MPQTQSAQKQPSITMIALRKYLWVGLTAARSNLAYPLEVASRFIFLTVILFIFLKLWQVTYGETGAQRLGGFTLQQMIWYLAMTEAITLSGTGVADEVDNDVRTGALAVQLIRPMSYPLYRFGSAMGERLVRWLMNVAVGGVIATAFVGFMPSLVEGLALCLLAVPLAFTLDFLIYFVVGLGAFWMEETSGLRLLVSRFTMIAGGMLIPLDLFPDSWQPILHALPFASIVYGPARLFAAPDLALLGELLVKQGLFTLLLIGAVAWLYRRGVARIHANGG
ncbi:MAG: ABC-2 family transporter protein [Anaerolineales bacterium]|nr:ABC-2 family transporter protein [Anaerolineales bacterium]